LLLVGGTTDKIVRKLFRQDTRSPAPRSSIIIPALSCFTSYSTQDQPFADRLYLDLQSRGIRCWFAPHDIQGGRKIYEQIDEAIRVYDKLLLILSESSM
jgi:TIR domain